MLRLRKVELLGFKSFCEKTQMAFSGNGITCIVGPNGCGKSNIADAVSWVLGEQSHKMLRAERMADCIFNGTAKRPPLGLAEVSLTLVDPELAEAAAKVLGMPESGATVADQGTEARAEDMANPALDASQELEVMVREIAEEELPEAPENEATEFAEAAEEAAAGRGGRKRRNRVAERLAHTKPGEVTIGRRLYRSGQSEYVINGRVARLRDIQELFMGMGLGPDSYAIIEQGRIGQILSSKPMDRRAIIEEAAGVTSFKTKRRLSEAKLEASKLNLARVNDILMEVEKQLGSLKRQASKARRYTELREEMRGVMRKVLASKARELDGEAERLQARLAEMAAKEGEEAAGLREMEAQQERLNARTYEMDGELKQATNQLNYCSLELDRAQNRIEFNRSQRATAEGRAMEVARDLESARTDAERAEAEARAHLENGKALEEQARALEAALAGLTEAATASAANEQSLEARILEQQQRAASMTEAAARAQADAEQAEAEVTRSGEAHLQQEMVHEGLREERTKRAEEWQAAETRQQEARDAAQRLNEALREAQARQQELQSQVQSASRQAEMTREELTAEKAKRGSIEQILDERAYSAEAVQKLFAANGQGEARGFRAVGLLADYAEVEEQYEGAVEQFLRDELEYVVVETFEHARAGISLLREEMGGRATFFVDSLRSLNLRLEEGEDGMAGAEVIARLDQLVQFKDPLGPAAKNFLPRLRAAFLVETAAAAERMSRENTQKYFLTPDGTCYHGRMVTGGRANEAGPLALKRELRARETEIVQLEKRAAMMLEEVQRLEAELKGAQREITSLGAAHLEAEKAAVAGAMQAEQAQTELARAERDLTGCEEALGRIGAQQQAAQERAREAAERHADSARERQRAEQAAEESRTQLALMRQGMQARQEEASTRRAEIAGVAERLAGAQAIEERLREELRQAQARANALSEQRAALEGEKSSLEAQCAETQRQAEALEAEKLRLGEKVALLEKEWEAAREQFGNVEEALRGKRNGLDALRSEKSQHEIEKARNDSDREHLRQTCVTEANAQPEELMAQETELLAGPELETAAMQYAELKARIEGMGAINMMALEEFQECEQRNGFLARERDDLVQSIENTQQAISELDAVSREKFERAFTLINQYFAEAFKTLFGGGTGEMRLTEADSSGDSGIDIAAQPPGKRLQNVLLLSGGEKAMTALALLIAVFRYQPSPFCILDEVDAPLDEANVGRFNRMLAEMGQQTQFIVVTHNRRTMEMGSVLYGVTMQEPGVSKLVSVRWDETREAQSTAA